MADLASDIQYLKGVGPARAEDFRRLGINSIRDLLLTFPRDISDRSNISTIASAPEEGEAVIMARVCALDEKTPRYGKLRSIVSADLEDETGRMEAVWFNAPWVAEKIEGATLLLYGKIKHSSGMLKMDHPQFEVVGVDKEGEQASLKMGRIVPIYPCTGKLTQNVWLKVMDIAIRECVEMLPELYPPDYIRDHNLMSRVEAVRNMHFPESEKKREEAVARLKYDECLMMQLVIAARRKSFHEEFTGRAFNVSRELDSRIRTLFPFRMTAAQERATREIAADMIKQEPMHRLLQGDVGSGKTAVAIYAMLVAVANHTQVCLMAPTGLLARQHFDTVTTFLANSNKSTVRVKMLVSGMKKAERDMLKVELSSGGTDILIATHSAIQDDIQFSDLGLVVIDEQHKFGVSQREALVQKGVRPDILVMTATPIPRSLALTVYGDLDASVIDELPPGRKEVKTSVPAANLEQKVWAFLRTELAKGRQAFIVSPLLEENEDLDLRSAKEAYEEMRHKELANFNVGLMHGKMSREEQVAVMNDFRDRKIDALVSTVVIEVGVDVPNANMMVVLHAERFGLAQLHQLRGRIGRGSEQGHFILLSTGKTQESQRRLVILARTNDGFEIAEEDLKMRGPGEFLGTKQHGLPELKIVDIVEDFRMIKEARGLAEELLPELSAPRFVVLRSEMEECFNLGVAGIG